LRNVDKRPRPDFVKAYGYHGYFKSLKEIVHFYNTREMLPKCAVGAQGEKVSCWPSPETPQNLNANCCSCRLKVCLAIRMRYSSHSQWARSISRQRTTPWIAGDRAALDDARELLALGVEHGRSSRRLAIDETLRPPSVEPQHPVADRLQTDTANARRLPTRAGVAEKEDVDEAHNMCGAYQQQVVAPTFQREFLQPSDEVSSRPISRSARLGLFEFLSPKVECGWDSLIAPPVL
jgi:hypothetical protein